MTVSQATFSPLERRNRIIHDPWFLDPIMEVVGQFKSMSHKDKGLKYGMKPVAAGFVDDTLNEIDSLIAETRRLFDQIHSELHPPPETPVGLQKHPDDQDNPASENDHEGLP